MVHFQTESSYMHFRLWIYCIPIEISQQLAHMGQTNNVTVLVEIMA